jgi:hypothetical protein
MGGRGWRHAALENKERERRVEAEPSRNGPASEQAAGESGREGKALIAPLLTILLTCLQKVASSVPSKSEARKSRTKEGSSSRRHSSQVVENKDHVRRSAIPTSPSSTRASGVPTSVAAAPASTRERRPSQGRRPTSELPPAADMNAVRAREVWEMDRLWKGRSMAYGLEGPHVVYAQSIGDVGSTTSVNALGHGSAHTSYKLQQGFPFPTPPPTTTATSAAASTATASPGMGMYSPQQYHPQQQHYQGKPSLYEFPSGVRSYPDLATMPSIGTPESTPSLTARNPLPAPPRQSAYRPGPMPASLMEKDDRAAVEYWSKYAGVSTH